MLERYQAGTSDLADLEMNIEKLKGNGIEEQERAAEWLVSLGPRSLPWLACLRRGPNKELGARARRVAEKIEPQSHWRLAAAAARVLIGREPPGAGRALLDYLPFVPDEETEADIWYALDSLYQKDRELEKNLAAALTDNLSARRAVAACILARRGLASNRVMISRLLHDPVAQVRLRAAQGLLTAKDTQAIPVLISLLDHHLIEISWQAEELLHWIAGDQAPAETVGAATTEPRRKCKAAWQAWWTNHAQKIDFDSLAKDHRRPLLVLFSRRSHPRNTRSGKVWLSGCDGKSRWFLDGLDSPFRAQISPGNNLLVFERTEVIVGKRLEISSLIRQSDLTGTLSAQQNVNGSFCQFLPNGNVFLGAGAGYWEQTPEGNLLFSNTIFIREGQVSNGRIVGLELSELDKERLLIFDLISRKENRVFLPEHYKASEIKRVHATRDGRFLIGRDRLDVVQGEVAEFDAKGKLTGQWPIQAVQGIQKLRNGNILVSDSNRCLFEVEDWNRTVWELLWEGNETSQLSFSLPFPLVRFGLDYPRPADLDLDSYKYRSKAIESPDADLRHFSMCYLANYLPGREKLFRLKPKEIDDEKLIQLMIAALRNPDPEIRAQAASNLGAFKEKATKAIPFLIKAWENKEWRTQSAVNGVFEQIGPTTIPILRKAMTSNVSQVRRNAVSVLTRFLDLFPESKELRETIPQCVKLFEDSDPDTRRFALIIVGNLDRTHVALKPVLLKALNDNDHALREAAMSLCEMKIFESKESLPLLIQYLKDPRNKAILGVALSPLLRLGPAGKDAVPALRAILSDKTAEHIGNRILVAKVLAEIGPAARDAVEELKEAALDANQDLRNEALRALTMTLRLDMENVVQILRAEQTEKERANKKDDHGIKESGWRLVFLSCALVALLLVALSVFLLRRKKRRSLVENRSPKTDSVVIAMTNTTNGAKKVLQTLMRCPRF
jgi:HEAT repeat protein